MPLPPPVPRTLKHTRTIVCQGFERADDLWDIEGHLTDVKTYTHSRRDGGQPRAPGELVHDMWLRLTIDLDLKVHDVAASTDASPYPHCGAITPNFERLKGATIGPGWRKKTLELLGGIKGCTHLVELLMPLGTTAFQATGRARDARRADKPSTRKPYQLNACHVYKDDSEAVKERWPAHYTGPAK